MLKSAPPASASAVGEKDFRNALRRFASGVTVITTLDAAGKAHGMTATAFCSLSLRPPLVLVAVGRETRCHRFVTERGLFGVNILSDVQADVSRHFGGSPSAGSLPAFDRLNDVPVLVDAMVRLSCRLERPLEGGDHSIFVGLVTAVSTSEGNPLLHFDGHYHALSRTPRA
jgi:flavin reductase (DIM6/NTAB) family NADH-FMN oxidoreductase RutF